MEADGTIRWDRLNRWAADWLTSHLYGERYHLSHNEFLDEPEEAVRCRMQVAAVVDERTRPKGGQ